MIEDLRPYAEMKPSGLPWLGDVPAHWDLFRLSRLSRVKSVTNQSERQLLSVYLNRGVVRFSDVDEKRTNATSEDLSKYQAVDPGDFVLNNQQAWRGSVGVSNYEGIVSPAYLVLALSSRLLRNYANYLFRDRSMVSQYLICSKGVGTIQRNLYWPHLKAVGVVVPPLDEQRLIVRFLDWHGAQTAKLIRAKKKIIALLNEQKQAIIHRAVTRGLDPNVRLKPSGIPWLGDVPEGWEVKPLKHWAGINRRTLSQNTDPDYAFDYVDISAVATGYLSATPERMRFEASPSRARRIVQQGDTLISTVRTYLKAIYHVDRPWPDLIASTGFAVLTPRPSIDARFFGFVLQSKTFVDQVVANSIGVAYPAISETRLGSLHVCLPPSRQEQEGIINHLQTATVDFDRSIEATQREITLIQEFRTRLIADVVTGKLDVRAAAASLPETVELEPIDDLVEGDELDEAVDDAENEEVAA